MMKTDLQKWIRKYENKTGEKFEPSNGFKLFFFPNRGFAEYAYTQDMVIVRQMCGDSLFWKQLSECLAISMCCKMIGSYCIRRNIEAYIRLFGYRIERTETLSDGLKRYFCVDKYGKRGQASPAGHSIKTGIQRYYITWEV